MKSSNKTPTAFLTQCSWKLTLLPPRRKLKPSFLKRLNPMSGLLHGKADSAQELTSTDPKKQQSPYRHRHDRAHPGAAHPRTPKPLSGSKNSPGSTSTDLASKTKTKDQIKQTKFCGNTNKTREKSQFFKKLSVSNTCLRREHSVFSEIRIRGYKKKHLKEQPKGLEV